MTRDWNLSCKTLLSVSKTLKGHSTALRPRKGKGMTHTEASSRRRFYRASQLKKQTRNNVLSAPPTGTGLDTGTTPQERGRRLPATASLWPAG